MKRFIVNFVGDKNFTIMTSAEIKVDIFRRLDQLQSDELERVYNRLLAVLKTSSNHKLSKDERNAIYEAQNYKGQRFTHDEVMSEAKSKYPNLNFK